MITWSPARRCRSPRCGSWRWAINTCMHRFVPPETFERTRLTRAEQTLDRRVTSLYASYLQRDPWFQDANLRALSGRTVRAPIKPSRNG